MFAKPIYIIMEKNESIEHVLENMDNNIVSKVKNPAFRSLSLMIAGIISFAVYASFEWKATDIFPHFLFMAGSTGVVCGVLMFFFRKSSFVSAGNNQRLTCSEASFQVSELNKLTKLIENGNLTGIKELKTSVSDGLKLRVMATKDGQICLSQVVAYVSSEYVNITAAKQHSAEDAAFFSEYFRRR